MLIVVHDRAVQRLDHATLDFKAARRGDVLQVDRTEAGPQADQGLHDLVGILGVEHDRNRVQSAEGLEERGLSLHDRQRGRRTDIAEAKHGAAIADDRDQAVCPGVTGGQRRLGGDRPAHLRDAGCVGDRQRALGVQWRLQGDRQFAALVGGEDFLVIDDEVRGGHRFRHRVRVLDRPCPPRPSVPMTVRWRVAFSGQDHRS